MGASTAPVVKECGMTPDVIAAFTFGVVFVIVLLGFSALIPRPTPFQYTVYRIVLSLAAAGVAATVPGFLNVNLDAKGVAIRAGGALAVFVIVYFLKPAGLPPENGGNVDQHQSGGNNSTNIQAGRDARIK